MTPEISPDVVEKVARAVSKPLADINGGCFNPDDDPQGECADQDCYCSRMGAEIARAAIAAMPDARAAALEEAKEVIRALQRAMPPLAKCSWNGACESALVALNALASQPAPALRTPGTVEVCKDDMAALFEACTPGLEQQGDCAWPEHSKCHRRTCPIRQEAK